MKAILSHRIYLETTREYEDYIKETLTYEVPTYNSSVLIRNFGIIRPGLMTLPIGRVDLIPEEYEIIDRRIKVSGKFPDSNFTLRPSQQAIYDGVNDNGIINAKPSWGKTYTALAIASKLAQKTLVAVHTVPLRDQWAGEVRKVYGIEPGIIGSSKFNIDSPIVIGNVQSLYNCTDKICRAFGTVILDEMHHVSSPTFAKILDKNYARYKIGLSGTLKRKDGKDVVFNDYFGYNIFKPELENSMEPEIDVFDSGLQIPSGTSWAARVNTLLESEEYRNLIHAIIDLYKNRKILVVADRVEFLHTCAELRENAVAITGQVKENRKTSIDSINTNINEIWGTIAIFKEGISQDILDTLVLAAPINNEPMLEQLIGRIQRIVPGKPKPRVVDIKFSGWTGNNQFQQRMGHYMRKGYKINYL